MESQSKNNNSSYLPLVLFFFLVPVLTFGVSELTAHFSVFILNTYNAYITTILISTIPYILVAYYFKKKGMRRILLVSYVLGISGLAIGIVILKLIAYLALTNHPLLISLAAWIFSILDGYALFITLGWLAIYGLALTKRIPIPIGIAVGATLLIYLALHGIIFESVDALKYPFLLIAGGLAVYYGQDAFLSKPIQVQKDLTLEDRRRLILFGIFALASVLLLLSLIPPSNNSVIAYIDGLQPNFKLFGTAIPIWTFISFEFSIALTILGLLILIVLNLRTYVIRKRGATST